MLNPSTRILFKRELNKLKKLAQNINFIKLEVKKINFLVVKYKEN
jgi:hypothetical protein